MKKIRLMLVLSAVMMLFPGLLSRVSAGMNDVTRQKLDLEAESAERLREALVSFLGIKDVVTIVNIDFLSQKEVSSRKNVRRWDEGVDVVLPGVPAAPTMTKNEENRTPLSPQVQMANFHVTVLVGKRINEKTMQKVKAIALNILSLDLEKGDSLEVELYDLPSKFSMFKNPRELLLLVGFLILIVFLFGPMRQFMREIAHGSAAAKTAGELNRPAIPEERAETSAREYIEKEIDQQPARNADAYTQNPSAASEENRAFSFLTEDKIEDFKLAIADESPRTIARIVQNLPSKFAFASIPENKLDEVIAEFMKIEYENPDDIKNLFSRIETKFRGQYGGARKLSSFIQVINKESQENILRVLGEKSPEFATEVQQRLLKFEDLLNYADRDLQRIFRKVGAEVFAQCVKGVSEEVAAAFSAKLGPNIDNLIQSRIKMLVGNGQDIDSTMLIFQAVQELSGKNIIPAIDKVRKNKTR